MTEGFSLSRGCWLKSPSKEIHKIGLFQDGHTIFYCSQGYGSQGSLREDVVSLWCQETERNTPLFWKWAVLHASLCSRTFFFCLCWEKLTINPKKFIKYNLYTRLPWILIFMKFEESVILLLRLYTTKRFDTRVIFKDPLFKLILIPN